MALTPSHLSTAHWRDAARRPKFFFMDANAALSLVIFVLHMRLWTLMAAFVGILFFVIIARFQFTVPVFLRWLRSFLAGPLRIAKPSFRD